MIDDATRRQWRRMFDARTAGPWAHEPGSGKVISITYRRGVAEVTHYEDADFVAQAYEGWPRTLEALEAAERERDEARNDLERVTSDRSEMRAMHAGLVGEKRVAIEQARIAIRERSESDRAVVAIGADLDAAKLRIDELERMLTSWRKHRNSPLLIADFDNYSRRHK